MWINPQGASAPVPSRRSGRRVDGLRPHTPALERAPISAPLCLDGPGRRPCAGPRRWLNADVPATEGGQSASVQAEWKRGCRRVLPLHGQPQGPRGPAMGTAFPRVSGQPAPAARPTRRAPPHVAPRAPAGVCATCAVPGGRRRGQPGRSFDGLGRVRAHFKVPLIKPRAGGGEPRAAISEASSRPPRTQ